MREKEMKEKKEMKERNRGFLKGFVGATIVAIAIVSAFAISPSGTSPLSGETVVSIDPLSQNVSAGETFTVNITIDPNGEPIAGAQADLLFDPSLIQANSVSYGGIFGPEGFPPDGTAWFISGTINNTNGTIRNIVALYIGTDGITTPGVFAIIEFTAGSIDGTSPLNLTNVMVGGPSGEVPIMVNNGSVIVVPEPPEITSYTISNITITPPQTTEIDVAFSEEVSWIIAIQKDATTVYDWTETSTNPTKKIWDGTYKVNGTIVPAGDYTVNVTGTSTTTGLSVVNDTETITVVSAPEDKTPPEIIDNTPSDAYTGDPFTFNATVTDNVQVSTVWVEYWYGTGSHTNGSMNNVADDYWEKTITVEDTLEILHYIISANDTSNNWNQTIQEDVTVTDNDDPSLDADNSDTSGTTGDVFHFNITASDNIEVDSVNASWSHGSLSGDLALTETAGHWLGEITLDGSLDDLTYRIQVNDTSGNFVLGPKKTVTVTDNDLPIITDVTAASNFLSSSCLWKVNISAVVTDNVEVDEVYVNISYPDGSYENFSIAQNDDTYYCNKSYGAVGSKAGTCEYYIWANDTHGNQNTSSIHQFVIPPDWDINGDENVNVLELTIVGQHWEETGDPGWIRADVNRDGMISVLDLISIGQNWTG